MLSKVIENNQVTIIGRVDSPFVFNHEVFGEGFYTVEILAKRTSGAEDRIPVMVSERLIDVHSDYTGEYIEVSGQFRSFNQHLENKTKLLLSVFAREVAFVEVEVDGTKTNRVNLTGYICKKPIYRKTPLGREITDILLAINRPYGKSDYIPCICWGRDARYMASLEVGDCIQVAGRIQSREYQKRVSETKSETRTAYEVSISTLELVQ